MRNVHLIFKVFMQYTRRYILFIKEKLNQLLLLFKRKKIFDRAKVNSNLTDFETTNSSIQPISNSIYEIVPQMGYSAISFNAEIPYTVVENDILSNPTILLIARNSTTLNQLTALFHNHFTVVTAENPLVAVESLKTTPSVSLIISDLELPLMEDGLALLRRIKSTTDFCHIPFIMLAEKADLQPKLKALKIGVEDYLIKPFEKEELLIRIDNLLKNYSDRLKFFLEARQYPVIQHEPNGHPFLAAEELEWMERLESYIQQHISDANLTAEDIAEGLCVSRAQLFRRVKKLTGLTPHDYLNEVRFNYAHKCLENKTYTSVKSVSYAVGMKQLSHFSHQFKLRFGKYPSDFFH